MEIEDQGEGKLVAKAGEREILRALIGRVQQATPGKEGEGVLVLTDLEAVDGSVDLEELAQAAMALKEFVDGEKLYLGVRKDHPRHDAIVRLYQGLGATGDLTIMGWD